MALGADYKAIRNVFGVSQPLARHAGIHHQGPFQAWSSPAATHDADWLFSQQTLPIAGGLDPGAKAARR